MAWGTGTISVEYQHTDGLGTPVVETNAAGQVIEHHDYTPWGEVFRMGPAIPVTWMPPPGRWENGIHWLG